MFFFSENKRGNIMHEIQIVSEDGSIVQTTAFYKEGMEIVVPEAVGKLQESDPSLFASILWQTARREAELELESNEVESEVEVFPTREHLRKHLREKYLKKKGGSF